MTYKRVVLKSAGALLLACVISLGFIVDSTRVFAIPDPDFYSGNDILYYDPDNSACTTGGLRGGSVKEKIWNYLIDKGLTSEQAAGIMGNMDAESGFVPTRRQGTSDLWNSNYNNNAWGLVQWDGGRRYSAPNGGVLGKLREKKPALEKYTAVKYDTARNPDTEIPAADLDELLLFELDYMYNESINRDVSERGYGVAKNEWETLKLQKTVDNATVFWHNNFEVSADSAEQVLGNRGGKAHDVYDEFNGKTSASPGASSGCADSTLDAKVLQYAWPKFRGSGFKERKPEYAEAIEAAKSDGRYIGGHNGVDCGGFVTTLLIDSGFEPNYNHSGKTSKGAGATDTQESWAKANWKSVGKGSTINPADLRPGDVAFSPGHTFVFVGKIEGFESNIASASLGDRAPMAGTENVTASDVTWYRKK